MENDSYTFKQSSRRKEDGQRRQREIERSKIYMNDEENKKEAGSFAEPVPLRIEGVERRNEAINRFFKLHITRKCLMFVTFDACYRELPVRKN